jgi:histidinol dehydrogenase
MPTPPIPLLRTADPGFAQAWRPLEQRRSQERARIEAAVAEIVADVRARGDAALIDATLRFDGYRLAPADLVMDPEGIAAGARLAESDDAALCIAAERIRRYHALRVPASWTHSERGDTLGQIVRPLANVALYVPAGVAPLASTVLMLGMPAAVAGVREVAMASPGERPHPAVLRAAQLAGVTRLHRVGGAQAVAALAYGTESVARVDKIVGPGNAYVQEAKRQVFGAVAIDAEAGPSEVFIVADASAPADFVAADLLAQAEHDATASAVLATPDAELARAVQLALGAQLEQLGKPELARRSLATRSALIATRDLGEAFDLANRYAAEHLQIMIRDPDRWLARVEHAGAIFVGPHSPVPLGDYVAGPSHVLPTGGTARFFSVVGVEDFQKRSSLIRIDAEAFARIGPAAQRLAKLEGLEAHARAIALRLSRIGEEPC